MPRKPKTLMFSVLTAPSKNTGTYETPKTYTVLGLLLGFMAGGPKMNRNLLNNQVRWLAVQVSDRQEMQGPENPTIQLFLIITYSAFTH